MSTNDYQNPVKNSKVWSNTKKQLIPTEFLISFDGDSQKQRPKIQIKVLENSCNVGRLIRNTQKSVITCQCYIDVGDKSMLVTLSW